MAEKERKGRKSSRFCANEERSSMEIDERRAVINLDRFFFLLPLLHLRKFPLYVHTCIHSSSSTRRTQFRKDRLTAWRCYITLPCAPDNLGLIKHWIQMYNEFTRPSSHRQIGLPSCIHTYIQADFLKLYSHPKHIMKQIKVHTGRN